MTNKEIVEPKEPKISTPWDLVEWLTAGAQETIKIVDVLEQRRSKVGLYYQLIGIAGRDDRPEDLLPKTLLFYERVEQDKGPQGKSQIWSETLKKVVPLTFEIELVRAVIETLQG